MFSGIGFPRSVIPALKTYLDRGGVLISLGDNVPFLIAMAQSESGVWEPSPPEPQFAWQTYEIEQAIGIKYIYDPPHHDQGVSFRPSALFLRHAPDIPQLSGRLASRWVVPRDGATYFPLIRAFRTDDVEIPGPLYLIRNGRSTAIACTDPLFVFPTRQDLWTSADAVLAGILRLADAVSRGVEPGPGDAVALDLDTPPAPKAALDRSPSDGVDPEDARPLVRWGRFNGSCLELDASPEKGGLPRVLAPGQTAALGLPADFTTPAAGCFLRIRGGYNVSGTGLNVSLGDRALWNERLVYIDTKDPGNFCGTLAGVPQEFTRIVFVPANAFADGAVLRISNEGTGTLAFDAVQLETPPERPRERCVGMGAGTYHKGLYPLSESARWGGIRMSLRTQWVGEPGDPHRFDKVDAQLDAMLTKGTAVQPILEGTPAWAAISEERLRAAERAKRPTTVPPDPEKYAEIVESFMTRHAGRVRQFEIWNEADIERFFRGSVEEYAALFLRIVPIIKKYDPDARVTPSGMAGVQTAFIDQLIRLKVLDAADFVALHPYAGKSPAWNLPYGLLEGYLFSKGVGLEIFCNESGFPSSNLEWFRAPPVLSPETQKRSIDIAVSRILADGLVKLSVFHAGEDTHGYGLFDDHGAPKPAYAVMSDYMNLNGPGSVRQDVSMVSAVGAPLTGVYVAGSRHADGRVALVVNPSEAPSGSAPGIRVLVPCAKAPAEVHATAEGSDVPVRCVPGDGFAELEFSAGKRTVVELAF